jgi:hypothetical protein
MFENVDWINLAEEKLQQGDILNIVMRSETT